jgi:phospholipase/carboxylesterase
MPNLPLAYEVAPMSKDPASPHPLLVLLHGRGADEHDLLRVVPPTVPDFFVVSVRAPYRFPYGGYTWFDLENIEDPNPDQLIESVGLLSKFLDEIRKVHGVDPDNIFLFGFSMGAIMALEVALRGSVRVTGVVAHSGCIARAEPIPHRSDPLHSPSIFIAHGTHDPVVPVWLARQSHEFLRQANLRVQYREYPIQHTISEESLRDASLWLLDQLAFERSDS